LAALAGMKAGTRGPLPWPIEREPGAAPRARRQSPQRLDDAGVKAASRERFAHDRFLEAPIGLIGQVLKRAAATRAGMPAARPLPGAGSQNVDNGADAALVTHCTEPSAHAVSRSGEGEIDRFPRMDCDAVAPRADAFHRELDHLTRCATHVPGFRA